MNTKNLENQAQENDFNYLFCKVKEIGEVLFGENFIKEFRVETNKGSWYDPEIVIDHCISLSVSPEMIFYYGRLVYYPGSRNEQQSEDFEQLGEVTKEKNENSIKFEIELEQMIFSALEAVVHYRWQRHCDSKAEY